MLIVFNQVSSSSSNSNSSNSSRSSSTVVVGASLSESHHYVTALMEFLYVCMYVCMYVCTVVIPYYVLIQNYIHVNFGKMQTSAHTSSWILAARTLLNSRRNLLEEQETLYMLAKRCCSSTARSAKARISILCSPFQLRLNQAKRCCSVRRHKSPCTLALSFSTRINQKVRFLFIKPG